MSIARFPAYARNKLLSFVIARHVLFVIASPDLSGRGNLGWGWRKQATSVCHCEEPQAKWQSRPCSRLSKSDYRAAEVDSGCLPSNGLCVRVPPGTHKASAIVFSGKREYQVTIWLIEYNFNRPHQSLGYLAPIEYIERELAKICPPVLPMWSASTVF